MDTRDSQCLYKIKNKFGGSIKPLGSVKAIRYRLHDYAGMIKLIEAVNGEIRNPTRLAQLYKICDKYEIKLEYAKNLTYDNAWLSGFIDSDGSIYYNKQTVQVIIAISQKNKLLLDLLVPLYKGEVYPIKTVDSFKWGVSNKVEVLAILDYLKENTLHSEKMNRARLIPIVYDCFKKDMHRSDPTTIEGKM